MPFMRTGVQYILPSSGFKIKLQLIVMLLDIFIYEGLNETENSFQCKIFKGLRCPTQNVDP